ncbi:adenylate/guanylate cyclase domain-containing protein [Mycobacterium sp. 1274761.0]|uniref:ATP-binding protein n=1 Tax=Mycobacterium sp. 1274761.0 TaxID=1834077 RepID=UPI001E340CF2|nr:adenylate/guanylate cyclase domain-containing protein [Mycobacterium sp. 1274761.0]
MSAPSGVVTFLFTDIEGSTRRWESDADAMRTALRAHDEVLRGAIEGHDGFLVKHTGDGVIAAFASPTSALDAAVAAQRKLELPVRMGVATGEAALQDGDYFGAVLNRAARVMAAGHGGQVLVAESTASLVNGFDLLDLGPRRLRDVPAPVTLFQVRAPGLTEEFPPLRTLDTSPGNLRPPPTSFVGRDAELPDIKEALRTQRLVTLTGVGGVGKTRLALEAATQVADEFPDGVWLFELATVSDPAAVPDAIACILGVTQQPGITVTESVATAQDGRIRLLLLDNCEHVLDAVADVTEAILTHSATARILATSREALGMPDEQVWRVRSLDVDTAVDLFMERARHVAQGFSAGDPEAISEICRRLDGIPLAVELAASRMASMTATEMRDRLDHRFRLLVGARRGLERHQTLRHAVQWSYDLLDEPEKTLLERCAVFAGGFDLESACAVSSFTDEFTTLDVLDALVRKSLVTADRSSGHTRYSMLETIRQFAEEQLAARGEADTVRSEHSRHFAAKADETFAVWDSPRQKEAYVWFATELPNLRTAFRWAADRDDLDTAATIVKRAGWFGALVDNFEPVAWAEEILESPCAADHPEFVSVCGVATLCYLLGRGDDALAYSEAGQQALAGSHADVPLSPEQLWLGAVYSAIDVPDRYVAFFREQRQRGPDPLQFARGCLAIALINAGRVQEALRDVEGLVEAAQTTGNPYARSFALLVRGMAQSAVDPDGALDTLRMGLEIAQQSGNRANVGYIVLTLAMTLNRIDDELGDPVVALDNIALAIRNYHESGNITQLRAALGIFMRFLYRHGDLEPAATIAGFACISPTSAPAVEEFNTTIADLREVLGDNTYATLAQDGAAMNMATAVTYASDQIDRIRRELQPLP